MIKKGTPQLIAFTTRTKVLFLKQTKEKVNRVTSEAVENKTKIHFSQVNEWIQIALREN